MSEGNKALVPSLVNVAVELDKNDVAAILMSRAETSLKKSIKVCQARDTELNKAISEKAKEVDAAREEAVAKHFKPTIETLVKAANDLGCVSVKNSTSCQGINNDKKEDLYGQLSVTGKKPHIDWTVCISVKQDATCKSLHKEHTALLKELKENRDNWMDFRRKLADLPALERRARAAVAEERLTRTSEGQELIKLLDDSLDDNIKLLGIS